MTFEDGAATNQETGVQTPENQTTSVPSNDAGFETIKGDDGIEFVKLPKDKFDEYVQGNMRNEDYTRSKQAISELISLLEESGEGQEAPKPPQAPVAGQPQGSPKVTPEKLAQVPKDVLEQYVAPLYNQMAKMEMQKEEAEFRQEFAPLFNGNKDQEKQIMIQVLSTCQKYSNADGTPLSLKQAFYMAYAPQMYTALQAAANPKPESKWGTEDRSLTTGPQKPINSVLEADEELERKLSQYGRN